jgi:EAL domain-containing protein (putative c-di-GMP-specific phosphodiesterase class I)
MASLAGKLSVRGRTHALIAIAAVGLVAVVALLTTVVIHGAGGLGVSQDNNRARLGIDLLVTVGANMPEVTESKVQRGFSRSERAGLDSAIDRGQSLGLLSSLTVWNPQGQIVYVDDASLTDRGAGEQVEVGQALSGRSVTSRDSTAFDLSTHQRTGTLDAFAPLRDERGHVYGSIETSLPLRPILAENAQVNRRILLFAIGGGSLLLLLLLPMTARVSRTVAESWVPGRRRVLKAFRRALAHDQIELEYQPQIDPTHGGLHAVEALVRWRHHGQLQSPATFLPIVEGTALMSALTDRVLELSLDQLAAWRAEGVRLRMSINLSPENLSCEGLPEQIGAALAEREIPGDQLTVEVTETAILADPERARAVLGAIRDLGVDVAVDDFGTGHASISRLHRLPISEVKIDRSFVNLVDERNRAYLTAIVRFAQALGLRIVAEGVEDAATLVYLRRLGCDLVQGHQISRPMPAHEVPLWRGRGALLSTSFRDAVAAAV